MIKSELHSPSSPDAEAGTSGLPDSEKFASFGNFFCTRLWGEGADRPPEMEDLKLAAATIQTLGDECSAASTSVKASAAVCAELQPGVASNTLPCQQDAVEAIVAEYADFLQNEEDPTAAMTSCTHLTFDQDNDGGSLEQPNCVATSAFISSPEIDNATETVPAPTFPTTEKCPITVPPTDVVPTTQLICLPSPSSTVVFGTPLAKRMLALGKLPYSFFGEEPETEVEPSIPSEANEVRKHVGDDQLSTSFGSGPDPLSVGSPSKRDDDESLLTPKRVDRKPPRITPLKLAPTTSKRTRTCASVVKVSRNVRSRIDEMSLTPEHGKVHESEDCPSPNLKMTLQSPKPCFSDEIKAHASRASSLSGLHATGLHAIVNGSTHVPPKKSPPHSSLPRAAISAAQSPLRSLNLTEVLISDYADNQISRRSSRHRFKPLEAWRNERLLYERTPGSVMPSVCGVALNRDCPTPDIPRKKTCLNETQISLVLAIPSSGGLASNSDSGTPEGSDSNTTFGTVKTPDMEMHTIVLSSHKAQSVAIPAYVRGILHCLQGELCFAVEAAGGIGEKDEVVLSAGDVFLFHGDERTTVISPKRSDAKLIWVNVTVPLREPFL